MKFNVSTNRKHIRQWSMLLVLLLFVKNIQRIDWLTNPKQLSLFLDLLDSSYPLEK